MKPYTNTAFMDRPPIAQRFRQARTASGLTQAQAGEAVGVSKQAVSGWESGASAPSYEHVKAIFTEHGISADWVITGDGEMKVAAATPPPRYRSLDDYDAARAARPQASGATAPPPAPEALTPWLIVSTIYDEEGRHVANEVKAFQQVAVPYAQTLRRDGTLVARDATPA